MYRKKLTQSSSWLMYRGKLTHIIVINVPQKTYSQKYVTETWYWYHRVLWTTYCGKLTHKNTLRKHDIYIIMYCGQLTVENLLTSSCTVENLPWKTYSHNTFPQYDLIFLFTTFYFSSVSFPFIYNFNIFFYYYIIISYIFE